MAATARIVALASALFVCAAAAPLAAQSAGEAAAGRIYVSRAALEQILAGYEEASHTSAYSSDIRSRARFEAALLRDRLELGDFRVGDQITLEVQDEAALSATYVVQPGPVINFPGMGELSLRGVLRSEIDSAVTQHLSRYIHQPKVRARSTIRITVVGEVTRPGFLAVDSGMLFTEVLGAAGGASANANLGRIRVERGRDRLWDGEPLNAAIVEGKTLDELSIQAGDRIIVPAQRRSDIGTWALRTIGSAVVLMLVKEML